MRLIDTVREKMEALKPPQYPVRTYTYRPNTRPWRRGDPEHTITVWGDAANPHAELKIKHSPYPRSNRKGFAKGEKCARSIYNGTSWCYIDSRCKVRFNDQESERRAA